MSAPPLSYEPFFGLKKKPFSLASDPEFLYESPSHIAALQALLAGIRRREGLLALTGDVGTGKTTICRAVLRNLDRTTFSAFIPDPFASRQDLLKMLLVDFGVTSIQDLTTGPLARAGRTELSYLLSSFLDTLVPLDAFVVVFIDEAQNMSQSLIEEVRILSDAFNRHGQLQLVFVGQLELLETLKSPGMRQVDQRITVYTQLAPLNHEDVVGYVHHRLQIAGASPNRPMFAPNALALIHEASGGIPRLINRICDRALDAAHLHRSPLIDRSTVAAVLDEAPAAIVVAPPAVRTTAPEPRVPLAAPEDPAAFATKVDAWLSRVDRSGTTHAQPVITPAPASPTTLDDEFATEAPPVVTAPLSAGRRYERRGERYMQKLGRRWARNLAIAAATIMALNVFVAAASYVPARLNGLLQAGALPPVPTAPVAHLQSVTVPSAPVEEPGAAQPSAVTLASGEHGSAAATGDFVVAVGAFTSTGRADRLIGWLAEAGFQAFRRRALAGEQTLQQVLLGPFESREEAERVLGQLRAGGDYADARIMANRPRQAVAP